MSADFSKVPTRDILDFAAAYPLAWIVPAADPSTALLMPLLIETDADGIPLSILGHMPVRGPASDVLRRDGKAVFLFLGANAYIPPGWVSQTDWAPTWNFLSLKIEAASMQVDEALTKPAVEALVRHMEARAGSGWTVDRIGPRYETLLAGITGFRAPISKIEPRFKLGQDESETVHDEIKRGLGDHPLADWME
ncbi:FMN-binding negative transcriptional regulator [Henriciella mobilis]|uniref:FMN-binding negative transcriptional regulator n=1 Tax=Henriciella mobilis TaxID=2305467 RepID=A0A399R709_9PROT|nr:FMN-binding negative transcriptional regulator [Henriciella mobilis]RIJ27170.1 hypothetical protein D1223_15195 [Henriciella mobilis]